MKRLSLFWILILFASGLRAEDAPIDVEVFYSKDDPHWVAADKKIAEVNAKFPRLRIARISYDDPAGYKKLTAREKDLGLKETGDLLILLGPIPLTSKGNNRHAETHFEAVVARAIDPNAGKGRLESAPDAFAKERFGKDATTAPLSEIEDGAVKLFKVMQGGKVAGYVADAYIPNRCPMCNDTQFLVAADPAFKILAIHAVRPLELYGTPLASERADAFLKQFVGRAPSETPQQVDGITGATKTVSAYENAVLSILSGFKEHAKK